MGKVNWLKTLMRKQAYGQNNIVITRILQTFGSRPKYTDVNFQTMATEGYGNFVVYACLDKITKAATAVNWKVMKYNKDGEPTEIPNHPAILRLENPNPIQGQSKFLERAIKFYYIAGESFIQKVMLGKQVGELYSLRPDRCVIRFGNTVDEPIIGFEYRAGITAVIDPNDVLHWKTFNPIDELDGLGRGQSLFAPIAKVVDQLNAMKDWNIGLMQNGARPSGAWVTEETLSDEEYDRVTGSLKQKSGPKNAGEVKLLEGGVKWQELSVNPKDLDWIEGEKQAIVQICMGMGVDPILIGFNQFSSYNNKAEAKKALYTETVNPILRELADELSPFLGLADDEYFDFDYSQVPVLQDDLNTLYNTVKLATWKTINEQRVMTGDKPVPGGDIILIPLTMTPLDSGINPKDDVEDEIEAQEELDRANTKSRNFKFEQKDAKKKDESALQAFTKTSMVLEKRFKTKVSSFFNAQSKRLKFKETKDDDIDTDDIPSDEDIDTNSDDIVDNLTNWDGEHQAMLTSLIPEWYDVSKNGIELSNAINGFDLDDKKIKSILDEKLLKYLQDYGANQVTNITNTTKNDLKAQLVAGMKNGESNAELKQRILDKMGFASATRATTIARTEVHNTIMMSNIETIKSVDDKQEIEWLTSEDERVRESHIACDGEVIKLGEKFSCGLAYPGEPGGDPSETVNCRCVTIVHR